MGRTTLWSFDATVIGMAPRKRTTIYRSFEYLVKFNSEQAGMVIPQTFVLVIRCSQHVGPACS